MISWKEIWWLKSNEDELWLPVRFISQPQQSIDHSRWRVYKRCMAAFVQQIKSLAIVEPRFEEFCFADMENFILLPPYDLRRNSYLTGVIQNFIAHSFYGAENDLEHCG